MRRPTRVGWGARYRNGCAINSGRRGERRGLTVGGVDSWDKVRVEEPVRQSRRAKTEGTRVKPRGRRP